MKTWKMILWTSTLLTVWWLAWVILTLIGGKGIDKMRVPVDGTVQGGAA